MSHLPSEKLIVFENDFVRFWFEDEIFFGLYKGGYQLTLEIAREVVETRISIFNGKRFPAYADVRELQGVDKEARKYLASDRASYLISAGAIHVNSPVSSWLGNVFLLLDRPEIPAKMFTSEAEAISWLKNFK